VVVYAGETSAMQSVADGLGLAARGVKGACTSVRDFTHACV